LVGIALFLSHLAHKKCKVSELRDHYPKYVISKNKIELNPSIDVDQLLLQMTINHSHLEIDTTDGLKIYFENEWVHLRKSNTEPIIRIYAESQNEETAKELSNRIILEIKALI
jgi:phosphomannomutase